MDDQKVKCVVFVDNKTERVGLRRYAPSAEGKCEHPGNHGIHNEIVMVGVRASTFSKDGYRETVEWDQDDPRWPVACACGFDLTPKTKQTFIKAEYRNSETGELATLEEMPAGGMYNAWWMADMQEWRGSDGQSLHVKLPNGIVWCVDARANNCDKPTDNEHKCWVRHGVAPNITADKNGLTCNAGAGSISAGSYHGFLTDGYLVKC